MYGIIYRTTNLANGKQYIGKHQCSLLSDGYIGSGKILKRAILKYGKQYFHRLVLWICHSKKQLDDMLKFFIKLYNAVSNPMFYNISLGGDGGFRDGTKPLGFGTTLTAKHAGLCNKKRIINLDTKLIFNSIQLAATSINVTPDSITRALPGNKKNKRKTCGRFHWDYCRD